ncbi:MAG TPA: SDR family oxidoreductase [Actinomycetales bacterium]|nr:SDR family oxidoreductase [Actinomycetales bacterium]
MNLERPVTIIGGHGKVALRVARILSDHGTDVYSIIRNPDHADDVREAGANPVVADVEELDAAGLAEKVVRGSGAVVWSAGAGGGNPDRTYAVDRDAAIRTMDACAEEGVDRFVMVSYQGAGPDHGVPEDSSFFPYAEAKAAADEYLRGTKLHWTILGPGKLTDEPGRDTIGVGEDMREDRATSRDEVAAVIAAVLRRPDTVGRTIEFTDGDTPIGEALTRE